MRVFNHDVRTKDGRVFTTGAALDAYAKQHLAEAKERARVMWEDTPANGDLVSLYDPDEGGMTAKEVQRFADMFSSRKPIE